ncbi:uncharacterized protein LOC121919591 isoform X2 [Sceloporus undulatus]|uniref:uncharacterized protein LOC121919591 isoform X2 n=1 Tax=Sceloporus undulatus TaxID=8520 RepID=UPI001C4C8937|nr:uncharacterized protein LOC121919591 isoform X2 [Sceloporus undulatus]
MSKGEINLVNDSNNTISHDLFLQTCFISIDDLLEAFDTFLEPPSLEYKIWLKIALDVALKTFKEHLPNQVQGTASATKLLVIRGIEHGGRKSTGACSILCQYHSDRRRATVGHIPLDSGSHSSVANDLDYTYVSTQNSTVKKD